jgi:hypothetical protein
MESFFRSVETYFVLGEHFAENTLDQRDVDAVWTFEDDCLKTVHVDKKGVKSVIERRLDGDIQKLIIKCNDVVCTNVWRKTGKPVDK